MISAVLYLNEKTLTQADGGICCVCVGIYGCLCKFCMCLFVWNLISASGPMALVCLHPKSKLCNYDDRPVLFISHLCLPLALFPSLSLSFLSLSLSFPHLLSVSLSHLSLSPLKGELDYTSSYNIKSSCTFFSVCNARDLHMLHMSFFLKMVCSLKKHFHFW